MSLHIKLSPEAQARLAKQQKQSTIMSIAIAVLTCVLLALLMTLIAIKVISPEIPVIVTVNASSAGEATDDEPTPERVEPPTPPENISQVLNSQSISDVAVPTFDDPLDFSEPVEDIIVDIEEFGEIATSDEVASAAQIDVIKLPPTLQKRCSVEDRLDRLRKNGAGARAEEAEQAVVKALDWLKETQGPDGSWVKEKYPVAMTGLAVLTYLGHCETPKSREYGETVFNAIAYLVDNGLKNDGYLTSDKSDKHYPYEHGIATYALGEALTFSKIINFEIEGLEEVLQKAGDIIIDRQGDKGSWDYSYKKENDDPKKKPRTDNSIGGWQIQALKACYHSKLEFKGINSAISKALGHFEDNQDNDGAIGYVGKPVKGKTKPVVTQAMAAVGALSHQIWNKSSASTTRKAIRYLDKNMNFDYNSPDCDLYGHYYASQVMINAGGEEWRNYNAKFLAPLLSAQNPDGTFKKVNNGGPVTASAAYWQKHKHIATHYRTCLATLMLETYYRFLPATGRRNR